MRNAVIHSNGIALPEKIVPNSYFDELLGADVSTWLEEFVEIYERRWLSEGESMADLCAGAAKMALERGGLSPEDIDLLIISTDTPEFISPSTASKVQFMTGMKNAAAFDLNAACSGFVTALDTAAKYIAADEHYKHIMVIGAYGMSRFLNPKDKKTVNLFADAAGAFILKAEENSDRGFLASRLLTKGEFYSYMGIFGGGSSDPASQQMIENESQYLQIGKRFPDGINPKTWAALANELSDKTSIDIEDFKQFFLTQININSIRETMDLLKIPRSSAQTSMHYYGYTGSACIPLAFEDALQAGKIQRGDNLMFIGSGGGLSFAAAAFRY